PSGVLFRVADPENITMTAPPPGSNSGSDKNSEVDVGTLPGYQQTCTARDVLPGSVVLERFVGVVSSEDIKHCFPFYYFWNLLAEAMQGHYLAGGRVDLGLVGDAENHVGV